MKATVLENGKAIQIDFVTKDQVAAELGVLKTWVGDQISNNKMESMKINGRLMIPTSEILRYAQDKREIIDNHKFRLEIKNRSHELKKEIEETRAKYGGSPITFFNDATVYNLTGLKAEEATRLDELNKSLETLQKIQSKLMDRSADLHRKMEETVEQHKDILNKMKQLIPEQNGEG